MCSNNLKTLPDELCTLSHMRVLRLKFNKLQDIPAVVSLLPMLETLDLSGNQINVLNSSSLGVLSRLRCAAASHRGHIVKHASGLSIIWQTASSKQIDLNFHALVIPCSVLDLSYNSLRDLAASLSELLHLRVLLLDHNELEQLPDGLEKCQNLTRIDVSYNKLTGLPGPLAQLPALQRIVASNNQLRSIPVSFGQLRQLKELDLRRVQPT